MKKRVIISLTDKRGIVPFAQVLVSQDFEIISTGGTAKALREGGVEVTDVAEVTGFPEMLDGRVKTLHPKVSGGILAIRGRQEHMAALAEHGICPIDMVVVNLYDFAAAVRKGASLEMLVENIDIGGPTMIRAAAKNWQDVAVVVDPHDYEGVATELCQSQGSLSNQTRWRLAQKAFRLTGEYDTLISQTLSLLDCSGEPAAMAHKAG